jgi:tRNA A-37 threonylcarbamoyl transferase component Bud32
MMDKKNLVGITFDARYQILHLIGEGATASVFEAADLVSGQNIALKLMRLPRASSNNAISRFRREARIAASLDNPHIANIVSTGESEGLPYIAMEYLQGRSLSQLVRDQAPLSPGRAAHIAIQALDGLDIAHKNHIVHRDLKPQNIYLAETMGDPDFVKLLDFGVAKLLPSGGEPISELTETGQTLGTLHYMSPEQAVGAGNVSAKSDIYSIGVILYQMLTGRLPFDAANRNALLVQILAAIPPDPCSLNSQIPEELGKIIKMAMARNPIQRIENCGELRARLLPFISTSESRPPQAEHRVTVAAEGVLGASGTTDHQQVRQVYDAIFIGLWMPPTDITLRTGDLVKVRALEDITDLLANLDDCYPDVIVSVVNVDLQAILDRYNNFFSPVIVVDATEAREQLTIHEWSEQTKSYAVRRGTLMDLGHEIEELCSGRIEKHDVEIDNICFSNQVETQAGTYYVETEIASHDAIRITTKIWSGGRIVELRHHDIEPVGEAATGAEVAQAAKAQHKTLIDAVLAGEYA